MNLATPKIEVIIRIRSPRDKEEVEANPTFLNENSNYLIFSGTKESRAVMLTEQGVPGSMLNHAFKGNNLSKTEQGQLGNPEVYDFSAIYDERVSNEELFVNQYKSKVKAAFKGTNTCFLFYGPVNAGKCFSVFGSAQNGLLKHSFSDLLKLAATRIPDKAAGNKAFRYTKLSIGAVQVVSKTVYDVMHEKTGKEVNVEHKESAWDNARELLKCSYTMHNVRSTDEFKNWLQLFQTKNTKLTEQVESKDKHHLVITVKGDLMRKIALKEPEMLKKEAFIINFVLLRPNQTANLGGKKGKRKIFKSIDNCFDDLIRLKESKIPLLESTLGLVLGNNYVSNSNFVLCGCIDPSEKAFKVSRQTVMVFA